MRMKASYSLIMSYIIILIIFLLDLLSAGQSHSYLFLTALSNFQRCSSRYRYFLRLFSLPNENVMTKSWRLTEISSCWILLPLSNIPERTFFGLFVFESDFRKRMRKASRTCMCGNYKANVGVATSKPSATIPNDWRSTLRISTHIIVLSVFLLTE